MLEKQNISISFGKGLDTKTDPNQVVLGQYLLLQNAVFDTGLEFKKRNGYSKIFSIPTGSGLANFKSELVSFDGNKLYSFNPSLESTTNKGNITSVGVSVSSVFRASGSQTHQDSAFHSSGLYLYVWVDATHGAQYMLVSQDTGNQIIPATSLSNTAVNPRAWALGNYLIVTYVDSSNNHLKYIAIPAVTTVARAATDISTQVNASNPNYDGVVLNNSLYLSFNGSDVGGAIRTTFLDPGLILHNTVVQAGENANSCIGVFSDASLTIPNVWVAYCNSAEVKYFILSSNGLGTVLSPTLIVGGLSNILNIAGYATSNSGVIYYQTQNNYSYASTRSDFVTSVTANSTATVGSPSVFLRSVGLISKVFSYNSHFYFVVSYNGALQPTYFLVNEVGTIIGKFAYQNGGGYGANANLCSVNAVSSTEFQFSYLFKDSLEVSQGQIYAQTGINSAVLGFTSENIYQSVELGNNLNITGGILWSYDGYAPTEQNFHLYPEDLSFTATSSPPGLAANTYSYIALYEWMDNQGNIQKSGYGTPLAATISFATSAITVNIPTLRLTQKSNVTVTLYRTAPSIATNIYYKVSSLTSPTPNDPTVDSLVISDTSADASITGNELLYTTGGVVIDVGGPPALTATNFKNRLMLIDAEDTNLLWYSKQTLQNTPVELSDQFTVYIDPRFGGMTALSVMDDKLIIFKNNAIFYMVGTGPDNTGSQNDFSEAVFVTSVVGCTNAKSIVLMQNGLMFQSNKGIWLLGRDLGVSYIGAPVEEFNANLVTSAALIPNTTQIRFTLDNGIALIYDYFYGIWGTFTNHSAVAGVVFDSLFTYLNSTGSCFQEAIGSYTDNGSPIFIGLTTPWLSLSGLQGFQRAYALYLFAKFVSPHILTVSVAYDFNPNVVQSVLINPTNLYNPNYGADPFYGSTEVYGGNYGVQRYRINLERQKCQSIQISIQEGLDTSNISYGAGIILEAISLLVGAKSTYPRLPPGQIVT